MTFEDAVLKALDQGPGNPREITERLQSRVRETLNRLAADGKIERLGAEGRGVEKIYRYPRLVPVAPVFTGRL